MEYITKPYNDEEIYKVLSPLVRKWFKKKFKTFSEPQKFGIMSIHKHENILVSAPTGTGKTLLGFLSIINELVDSSVKGILEDRIYCIYISPLRALSRDIEKNLKEPLKEIEETAKKKLGIRVAVRTGDTTQKERRTMLKKPPHILITTPESLAILLTSLKFKEHLKGIEWCIVDEIHSLAENKRGVHLSLSLERLQKSCKHITRIGLSATISPLEEIAKFLVGYQDSCLRNCKIASVDVSKKLDLKVLSPVEDMINTKYEKFHKNLYFLINDLIQKHRTTLIFTNTRAATERVIDQLKELFPKNYSDNIGAHHGSLSSYKRRKIEDRLKKGELKAVVTSTSLELGIDIGYIDLVVCLGSPKSVARLLQRCGRAGHCLHDSIKGRLIVMDRDDLVECSLLLKNALERKIDKVTIPTLCLDVLAQQINGITVMERININHLFSLVKQSYCYHNLSFEDFMDVIDYLSGKYVSLEDRHIYAKIWYDKSTGEIGKKGRLGRVIHITNIGTIPEEAVVKVKLRGTDHVIGMIDEAFLERLKKGDVFVLGGEKYEFAYAKGTVVYVNQSVQRTPTIPSWFSEMLPLSFDIALEVAKFRGLVNEKLKNKVSKKEIINFIRSYLHIDSNAADAIYNYFNEQFLFLDIPTDKKIIVERYKQVDKTYLIFHTMFGRKVNDALSRAIAFIISKLNKRDIEIAINDNGFFIASNSKIQLNRVIKILLESDFRDLLEISINNTEVLKRRFRHCAVRAMMILKRYKGIEKRVGRMQVGSSILLSAVKRIDENFCILKEARREVLEDLMDIKSAELIINKIKKGSLKIKELNTVLPSPFAFNIILQSYSDLFKMEDKADFLKRMHCLIMKKINFEIGSSSNK